MTIDERIAAELRRHAPEVDEHAAWDRIQSAAPARRRSRAIRLVAMSAAAFGFVLLGFILLPNLSSGPQPASDPQSPFLGTWVTSDLDGSTPTMTIQGLEDGTAEITVLDDFASVCSGAPSTMTGIGRLEGDRELVLPSAALTCDDGSQPEALSGPPLEEQLQDLTFTHDPGTDTLTDNFGSLWAREGQQDPNPEANSGMWPQSSLEEVEEAQRLADAGDPDFTWQVEPITVENLGSAEIFGRFLREELGWEEFIVDPFWGGDHGEGTISGVRYLRCAPGSTNPLYPNDPLAGECAPTIDEFRYETVEIDVAQPGRRDPTGIWVVTAWRTVESIQQMAPPSDSEVTALFVPFLQARIDGEGAEDYLDETVPLLYGTTTGARYESFEFEPLDGPEWPDAGSRFKVRLFAQGGATVVEQLFRVDRDAPGPLDLEYSLDGSSTTENGQPVTELPQSHEFRDGEVTFGAVPSWDYSFAGWEFSPTMATLLLDRAHEERLVLLIDPQPIETGCVKAPVPIDANALASSLRSDPDLEVTEPVPARIAGMEGLQMDVVSATSGNLCEEVGVPEVVAGSTATGLERGQRMRLYLIDYPGESAQVFAIAIVAPEDRFESVLEAATPTLDSVEFHTG
jgi:hypothetical protein